MGDLAEAGLKCIWGILAAKVWLKKKNLCSHLLLSKAGPR